MAKLFAVRYTGATYAGLDPAETFTDLADVGLGWSLPGGLKRAEVTVRAKSTLGAYTRYRDHLGMRLAIYDSFCDRYVAGNIFEVVPDGRFLTYILGGPWKRSFDDFYEAGDRPATGNTDVLIKDVLTDSMNIDSTDQTNIEASSVDGAGWFPAEQDRAISRILAGDAIKELAAIGNSSDKPTDFYFVDQPFDGLQMQSPLPYLKARSSTADPDWQFSRADLAPGGLTMARNIWKVKTALRILYNRVEGTQTQAGGSALLIDAGATFIASRVGPGDKVMNITTATTYTVASVDLETQITLTDTSSPNFTQNDVYSIKLQTANETAPGTATENYWAVAGMEKRPNLTGTQAEQLRDQLLSIYSEAVQQQSFVISAPRIKDGKGALWPLWRPIFSDSFYFRVTDIFPAAAVFDDSEDQIQTFLAVAMDYTFRNNRLRVVPTTNDSRLDAILNQAGLIEGQIINTETFIKNEIRRRREEAAAERARKKAEQYRLDRLWEKEQGLPHKGVEGVYY